MILKQSELWKKIDKKVMDHDQNMVLKQTELWKKIEKKAMDHDQNFAEMRNELNEHFINREKETKTLDDVLKKAGQIDTNMNEHTNKWNDNLERRKQLEVRQFHKLNSVENKLLSLIISATNSTHLHQELNGQMNKQLFDIARLENRLIAGFNKNSIEQNKLVRKIDGNELQRQMHVKDLNISIISIGNMVYTILKSHISSINALQDVKKQNKQSERTLNGTIKTLYNDIQDIRKENNESETKLNDTIHTLHNQMQDIRKEKAGLEKNINETVNTLYNQLRDVKKYDDLVRQLTDNVIVLYQELREIKGGKFSEFLVKTFPPIIQRYICNVYSKCSG